MRRRDSESSGRFPFALQTFKISVKKSRFMDASLLPLASYFMFEAHHCNKMHHMQGSLVCERKLKMASLSPQWSSADEKEQGEMCLWEAGVGWGWGWLSYRVETGRSSARRAWDDTGLAHKQEVSNWAVSSMCLPAQPDCKHNFIPLYVNYTWTRKITTESQECGFLYSAFMGALPLATIHW